MNLEKVLHSIEEETRNCGFSMPSDAVVGRFLQSLVSSRINGNFLEMGTGTGLGSAYMLAGMGAKASLTTFDNDEKLLAIAQKYLGHDDRISIQHCDGADWVRSNSMKRYDLIFADTWHGKYLLLEETLAMLKVGGFYLVDDLFPQDNWPVGHAEKVTALKLNLLNRKDLNSVYLECGTGMILSVKI